MQYGGVAGDPSYDMGLETAPVSVQEAIQSALEDTGSDDNTPRPGVRLPSTFKRAQGRRPTGITSINLPGYAGTIVNELKDFVTGKKGFQPFLEQLPGGGFNFGAKIPMNFFANGGFVDDSEIGMDDDSQLTQDDINTINQSDSINFDNYVDETSAMQAAQGIVGLAGKNRSNIRNSQNYDPIYAQALNITRGILPGNQVIGSYPTASKFQKQQDLQLPPSMTPTISGKAGKFGPQYYSGFEKFLQEDAPGLVKQGMNMGVMGIFSKLFGQVSNLLSPQQVKRSDTQ